MVDGFRMWMAYVAASARSQMQYRTSFVVAAFGQFLATGIEFVGIWVLFDRFDNLRGWTLPEVALFYGVAHLSLASADMLCGGFDKVGEMVRRGDLDRLLLRPRGTALQLLGHELTLRRLGRFSQGLLVLMWAVWRLGLEVQPFLVGQLALTVACAACMFLGLFILQATMSIWTVQTLELVNCTTYGGAFAGQHPFAIYERWFRRAFTFIVPLGCVIYFPLLTVLRKPDPNGAPAGLGYVSLLAGPAFLWLALQVWNWGVRRYTSTGS